MILVFFIKFVTIKILIKTTFKFFSKKFYIFNKNPNEIIKKIIITKINYLKIRLILKLKLIYNFKLLFIK